MCAGYAPPEKPAPPLPVALETPSAPLNEPGDAVPPARNDSSASPAFLVPNNSDLRRSLVAIEYDAYNCYKNLREASTASQKQSTATMSDQQTALVDLIANNRQTIEDIGPNAIKWAPGPDDYALLQKIYKSSRESAVLNDRAKAYLTENFSILDTNKDGELSTGEIAKLSPDDRSQVAMAARSDEEIVRNYIYEYHDRIANLSRDSWSGKALHVETNITRDDVGAMTAENMALQHARAVYAEARQEMGAYIGGFLGVAATKVLMAEGRMKWISLACIPAGMAVGSAAGYEMGVLQSDSAAPKITQFIGDYNNIVPQTAPDTIDPNVPPPKREEPKQPIRYRRRYF